MIDWYGAHPSWWAPFEADARRRYGPELTHEYRADLNTGLPIAALPRDRGVRLVYQVRDVLVVGTPAVVDVAITFWAQPAYDTYGQAPQDFPQVHAEPGLASPHRYPNDALCLWYPWDPVEQRWHHGRGLLDLLEVTRRHLYMERHWRRTGGHRGGVWLLTDAPHGTPAA